MANSSGPQKLLRIADANLNRATEGLRLLEDVARLYLDDAALSQTLKEMRHKLGEAPPSVTRLMLSARDAASDVGGAQSEETQLRSDLAGVVLANSKRAQEALRVLEEMAKVIEIRAMLSWVDFKQVRFALYDLEQSLLAKVRRKDRLGRLPGLYVIIDSRAVPGREAQTARLALRGGASVIQLRDKQHSKRELLPLAHEIANLCSQSGALFIMNDHLDVALAVAADGLHMGQDDLPMLTARRLMPPDMILGWSTHTVEEARMASEQGADYIAVGTIYPSLSKPGLPAVGLEFIRQVKQIVSQPLVAIGGINEKNVTEVIEAGASAAAVISAVTCADDVEAAARAICRRIAAK